MSKAGRRAATDAGRAGEEAAATYLKSLGYRIVARNVRYRLGELDLVAEHGSYLVFIEVKTRMGLGYGSGAEAVTPAKQRQLARLASLYLAGLGTLDRPCRFDVVAVEPGVNGTWSCSLIQDAFQVG